MNVYLDLGQNNTLYSAVENLSSLKSWCFETMASNSVQQCRSMLNSKRESLLMILSETQLEGNKISPLRQCSSIDVSVRNM